VTRTLPRVAVIGAGSSGIAATKALRAGGLDVTTFEKSDRVGGNWVFGNRNGMSAAYRFLHINTSRERMEFPDFPMPKSCPDFPHHSHIAEYFDDYVDHFGFRDAIRFETGIERAERRADGTWELTTEAGRREPFEMLLVANGHHWNARWPEPAFPGAHEFEGVQMHAHSYVDNEMLAGKDVVVLGMGNSAMDIAVESSYVARTTHLAARRGAWVIPKYFAGRPVDQLGNDPRVPFRVKQKLFEGLMRLYVGRMQDYGLPKPDHGIAEAHPTISGRILDRIAHGTVAPRANIARLHAEEVEFADGTRVHADVVIYCTGYKITFPFFDESFISAPENHIELFWRVWHPDVRNLAFIGLLQPLGAIMPLAAAQGEWVTSYLRGEYHLPSRGAMLAHIQADQRAMRRRYVASKRHTIQVDFDEYLYRLAKERRSGAERARQYSGALPVEAAASAAVAA
jgi:dimethylaniline monooxygenase (N-oxide forming)